MVRRLLLNKLATLNLFESKDDSLLTEEEREMIIHQQKISTRLYLVLFILFIIIFIVYGLAMKRTITVTVNKPTQEKFLQLANRYPSTIQCPCHSSDIAIKYNQFVQVETRLHTVCSSQLITQEWFNRLYTVNMYSVADVRIILSAYWQLIDGFCRLSNKLVEDIVDQLDSSSLLTPLAMTDILLKTQTHATLDTTLGNTRSKLARNMIAVRQLTIGNQLVSGLATNFYMHRWTTSIWTSANAIASPTLWSDNCSCLSITNACLMSATIIDRNNRTIQVPGMMSHCLPLDATLASTLECFYSNSCLTNILALNTTLLMPTKNQNISMTLENILIDELMIDEMNVSISHDAYYLQCAPITCSYTFTQRFNILYTLTLIIGLIGGLAAILRLIIPLGVKITLKIFARCVACRRRAPVSVLQTTTTANHAISILDRVRLYWSKIREILVTLNVFDEGRYEYTTDPVIVHRLRITTRLYFLFLISSIIVICFYTFLLKQTKLITVSSPDQSEYTWLWNQFGETLQCPCSQLSSANSDLFNLTATFHQVCSSAFVSSSWSDHLSQINKTLPYDTYDFRPIGSAYFQLLSIICSLAKSSVFDAKLAFLAQRYVHDHLVTPDAFEEQIKILVNTFTNTTRNEFVRNLALIRGTTQTNLIISANNINTLTYALSNKQVVTTSGWISFYNPSAPGYQYSDPCDCLAEGSKCFYGTGFFIPIGSEMESFDDIPYWMDSLFIGCLPIDSVFISSLACWYDSNCLSIIHLYFGKAGVPDDFNITPLNSEETSRFEITSAFGSLSNEMLIENWTLIVSYDNYFTSRCAPKFCSYTKEEQYDTLLVILTVIGLYGGLSKALKLILPPVVSLIFIIVKYIRHRRTQRLASIEHPPTTLSRQVRSYAIKIRDYFMSLNMFARGINDNNDDLARNQLSTRLYLILLILSTAILIFYAGFIERIQSVTVKISTRNDYEELLSKVGYSLECPCQNLAIPYSDFIEMNVTFHPVCNSQFVDNEWISYVMGYGFVNDADIRDFRRWGATYFVLIQSLCQLAQSTVNDVIRLFKSTRLLSPYLIDYRNKLFYERINATLIDLERSTPINVAHALELVRITTQGNALMSALGNNWNMFVGNDDQFSTPFINQAVLYNNGSCSCATSSSCTEPTGLYNITVVPVKLFLNIDGLVRGCILVDALLASSLVCFYSLECFSSLIANMPYGGEQVYSQYSHYFVANYLNRLLNETGSKYLPNATLLTVVNELFIDRWSTNVSFDLYYSSCTLKQCSYTFIQRFDLVYILTMFISLFGGLSTAWHFIIPYLVRIGQKLRNKFCRRHNNSTVVPLNT